MPPTVFVVFKDFRHLNDRGEDLFTGAHCAVGGGRGGPTVEAIPSGGTEESCWEREREREREKLVSKSHFPTFSHSHIFFIPISSPNSFHTFPFLIPIFLYSE